MPQVADIRKEYRQHKLSIEDVSANAMEQFDRWWQEAVSSDIDEVNAMTLATASADGLPAARIVLLKGYHDRGFQFFTNYDSFKGKQLQENPRACLVFFWKELERQIRITGIVEKVSQKESDEYFQSRPAGSRIGAWGHPLESEVIESAVMAQPKGPVRWKQNLQINGIPRPPHWGGYLVRPVTIEFWQGRPNRLHDRLQYSLQENGTWKIDRLAP